jgi:hypothetical protein
VSRRDCDDNPERRARGSILRQRSNTQRKEIVSTDNADIRKQLHALRRESGESRCQRTENPGNKNRVRRPAPRRSDNPRSSPLRLHRGSQFSPKLLANCALCFLPILELGGAIGKSLLTLIKNVLMPCRRVDRFGRSRQVLPQRFHRGKLFLNRHLIQWKLYRHDCSIQRSAYDTFRCGCRFDVFRVEDCSEFACQTNQNRRFGSILQNVQIRKSISYVRSEGAGNPSSSVR